MQRRTCYLLSSLVLLAACSSNENGETAPDEAPLSAAPIEIAAAPDDVEVVEAPEPVGSDPDGSCEDLRSFAAVTGLRSLRAFERQFTSLDRNASAYALADTSAAVASDNVVLHVSAEAVLVDAPVPKQPTLDTRLSCIGPYLESTGRLRAVTIVSDADWTDEFPAGTSLVPIVQARAFATGPAPSSVEIDEWLAPDYIDFPERSDPYGALRSIDEIVSRGAGVPLVLAFRLDSPDEAREHRFTVTYALEDGNVFTVTSPAVTITGPQPITDLAGTAWELRELRIAGTAESVEPIGDPDRTPNSTGIEFGPQGSQLVFVVAGRGFCEVNIRLTSGRLEIRAEDDRDPSVQTNRSCFLDGDLGTLERALDEFLAAGFYDTSIEGRDLVISASDGDELIFEIVD